MSYALRITRNGEEMMPFWERLAGSCLRIIAYEHLDGARVHCHATVEGATVSTDTMKNWIKKALAVTVFPRTDWKFTAYDGDEKAITYMSKGKYDPIYQKGHDPEEIRRLKGTWLDYATLMRSTDPKKPVAPALKWADMLDIAEKRFRSQEKLGETFHRTIEIAIDISRQVVYVENKALVGRHKFRDFVDTIVARVYDKYEWGRVQLNFMSYRS